MSGIKDIKGELMEVDCLIGKPNGLVYFDSRLFIYDPYEQKTLTLLNTKNNQCISREISIGNGVGEVNPPLRLSVSNRDKNMYVFQTQSGVFNTYHFSENELTLKESVSIKERPANIVATQDVLVGIGPFQDKRYRIYDKQGNLKYETGAYPFEGDRLKPYTRFFLYQGHICAQPNGIHFAMGSSYSDNLEFYVIRNNETQLLKRYGDKDVKASFNNTIQLNDLCLIGYKGAYATEKYCYMLYSGKTFAENDYRRMWATHIFVFEWNGEFVQSFRLDKEVLSFCVDESNHFFYGIVGHKNEAALMKFKM